jgi:hypothetical protein
MVILQVRFITVREAGCPWVYEIRATIRNVLPPPFHG